MVVLPTTEIIEPKYSQLKQEQDKRASKKVLQLGNTFLRCFLIWAHVFSIGLYSGE